METTFKNQSKIKLFMAFAVMLFMAFTSCKGSLSPAFTGIYVNNAGSEASVASDTLIVGQENGNSYTIHRRTGFRLLDDNGKAGALQHERETWTAVYDPLTQIMTESNGGKLITFDTENGTMTVGKRKYKRIK